MVPVEPIVDVLCKVGKKIGPILIKVFKNKKVQEVGIRAASEAASQMIQNRLNDRELNPKQKLKLLSKMRKCNEISEEQYRTHRDRILNSL